MTVNIRDMRVAALVNAASGRCDLRAGEALRASLADHGVRPAVSWCGPGAELERALESALAQRPDLVIVRGGDGTIRTAAQLCAEAGTVLAPLPGGTMNLLPRALYGTADWRQALGRILAAPARRKIHGARAQGQLFFAAGLFGGPSRLAEAREAVRYGELSAALRSGLAAVKSALDQEIVCRVDGETATAGEAVAVLCPLASRRLPSEAPLLEAAAVDLEGTLDALRLVLNAAFRDWRADPAVRCSETTGLEIDSDAPVPALLDGERFEFAAPFRVEVVGQAFEALVPAA